jgi:hypothetical protein
MRVVACTKAGYTIRMKLSATNPTAKSLEYRYVPLWYHSDGSLAHPAGIGGEATTETISPGQTVQFFVGGRTPAEAGMRCAVKVLGTVDAS